MLEILEFILLITLGLINLSVWIYFSFVPTLLCEAFAIGKKCIYT